MMNKWIHEHIYVVVTEISKVGQNFMSFGPFYDTRTKLGLNCPKSCELCNVNFGRSDMIHLAFTSKGNKIICDDCFDEARLHGCEIVNMEKVSDEW